MDEVKAMARAGEGMGKVVGTGMRTARRGATRAGRTGFELSKQAAARADKQLADRGISTEELQDRLARRATGMSRKQLAKRGRKTRKQLAKNTQVARKELAARIAPGQRKARRKWPWALLILTGMALVAAAVLSRRPEELPVADQEHTYGADHEDESSSARPPEQRPPEENRTSRGRHAEKSATPGPGSG